MRRGKETVKTGARAAETFGRRRALKTSVGGRQRRPGMKAKVLRGYDYFEQFIVLILLALMMLVVLYATAGFLLTVGRLMIERLGAGEAHITLPLLHEVFAGFLLLLIGLELMKTIAMYLDEHVIHVEVVLSVALIAIARHAIDVDYKTVPALSMIGTGSIIIALAVGYYCFKKASLLPAPGKTALAPLRAGQSDGVEGQSLSS
jgi:uncharacterized membrane protein (DUF373 family)